MRALLITVGTGETVEDGIAFSINTLNPDAVYRLCTGVSLAKLPLVRERLERPELISDPTVPVRDPADFDRTYARIVRTPWRAPWRTVSSRRASRRTSPAAPLYGGGAGCGCGGWWCPAVYLH